MTTQATRRNDRTPKLRESVEQVWLAGLGALALTEQEGMRFFRSLVKRGETVERRTRAQLQDAMAAAREVPTTAMSRLESGMDQTMTSVLHRMGVPTQDDIASLTRRIEGLTTTLESQAPRPRRTTAKRAPTRAPKRTATTRTATTRTTSTRAPRRKATTATA
jgi:poly(hydroxyalkanoate) granule-associated protein